MNKVSSEIEKVNGKVENGKVENGKAETSKVENVKAENGKVEKLMESRSRAASFPVKALPERPTGTPPAQYYDALAVSGTGQERLFTAEEVARHNLPKDGWISCHDGVYDVTEFLGKHPGGRVIDLGLGRDSTILVESYHPAGRPDKVLEKYRIGTLKDYQTFYNWKDSQFYHEMKQRVVQRMKEAGVPRGGRLSVKATLVLLLFVGSFFLMVTQGSFFWAACWGLAGSHIGLSIQHDGNHGAFSTTSWLNRLAGWGMDVIGASSAAWEYQHVVGHHQYTNLVSDEKFSLPENDPDVFSSYPLLRMHPDTAWKPHHQLQHIFALPLFALMTISKVLISDFETYLAVRRGSIDCSARLVPLEGKLLFWGAKILGFLLQIAVPCYLHGIPTGLSLFTMAHLVSGEYLAVCFIINHISESCDYLSRSAVLGAKVTDMLQSAQKEADAKRKHPVPPLNDWAATQVQCCVNWRSGGVLSNHLSGGLNHQIEHHLFPSISHANYPLIAPVVRQVCQEFGLPYKNYNRFLDAVHAMLEHLRAMGMKPNKKLEEDSSEEVCPVLKAAAANTDGSEGICPSVPTQA